MIAIVDYGMGNLQSVANILEYVKQQCVITNKKEEIEAAEKIILPGVGAFGKAMENLKKLDLMGVLTQEVMEKEKPFLGICLGMQLIADKGYEMGEFDGLGWVKGEVRKMELNDESLCLPHIGWNEVEVQKPSVLYGNDLTARVCYFVHSYNFVCADKNDISGLTDYGGKFVASIEKKNILATQFHPEKSQKDGLRLLENFIKY